MQLAEIETFTFAMVILLRKKTLSFYVFNGLHLRLNWNLTYTGGEAAPWTAPRPNASDSSATLKRGDADKEEEESGQSELHVQNPSSGQLAPVGRLFVMKPGSFLAGVQSVHGLDLSISLPCQHPLVHFAMGQAKVKNLMMIHIMARCVCHKSCYNIVGLASDDKYVYILCFNEECFV